MRPHPRTTSPPRDQGGVGPPVDVMGAKDHPEGSLSIFPRHKDHNHPPFFPPFSDRIFLCFYVCCVVFVCVCFPSHAPTPPPSKCALYCILKLTKKKQKTTHAQTTAIPPSIPLGGYPGALPIIFPTPQKMTNLHFRSFLFWSFYFLLFSFLFSNHSSVDRSPITDSEICHCKNVSKYAEEEENRFVCS